MQGYRHVTVCGGLRLSSSESNYLNQHPLTALIHVNLVQTYPGG